MAEEIPILTRSSTVGPLDAAEREILARLPGLSGVPGLPVAGTSAPAGSAAGQPGPTPDATVVLDGTTVRLGPVNIPMAGGGYFRLLPYWWTRWGIRRVNQREGLPAIFYLHPWELDTEQPRLPASRLSRFRHYRNLHRTEDRLRQLLTDFRFDTLPVAIAAVKSASSADEKVA